MVRDWLGTLDEKKFSPNYKTVLFTVLSSIMDSAVEDKLITANPCKGKSIKRPTSSSPDIVVWPEDRLWAVQSGLADRFRIICAAGAGCGLRQGEILGLSLDDVDPADMCLHVQRQIRVVGRTLVFAFPKGGKKRRVPLSTAVIAAMRVHERAFPSTEIALPWGEPGGKPVTVRLLVTGEGGRLYTGDCSTRWCGRARSGRLGWRTGSGRTGCTRYGTSTPRLCSHRGCRSRSWPSTWATPTLVSRSGRTPTWSRPATSGPGWQSTACSAQRRLTAWRRPDHGYWA